MMLAYDSFIFEQKTREVDDNGFLHVPCCNITKEQVAPYEGKDIPGWQEQGLDPNKIYYGYRKGSEIERAADTFNNLPLLDKHIEVCPENESIVKQHLVGNIGDRAEYNKPYLQNSLAIYMHDAKDNVENNSKKELSCAYRYDPVFEEGVFDGKRYDFVMTNIRGNHVALCERGRAGGDVVVADSLTKGVKMSENLKKLVSIFSSKKLAMDEGMADQIGEAISEIVDEKLEEKLNETAPTSKDVEGQKKKEEAEDGVVDKRKLIDEIGGILKGKVDDEIIRTVLQKAEELSYNDSENKANDTVLGKDEDELEKVKEEAEEKAKQMAKDSAESIKKHYKDLFTAGQAVRPLIGSVDIMAFDSADAIYEKALRLNGINTEGKSPAGFAGMCEVLINSKREKLAMDAMPAEKFDGFEALKNIEVKG